MKPFKRQTGFTLIELIVVLAVLASSLAIAVPNYLGVQSASSLRADLSSVAMLEKAEAHYQILHQSHSFDETIEQTADNFQDSLNNLTDFIDPFEFKVITDVHWAKQDNRWHIVYNTTVQTETAESSDEEDEALPDYPQWDPNQDHYDGGDKVLYHGRVFEARWWTNSEPGILGNPWIEITDEWRNFNQYDQGATVEYNGAQFKARYYINPGAPAPGTLSGSWDEITNEWRNFNVYNSGDTVEYMGHTYRARWYTQNEKPGNANVWTLIN